MSALYPAVTGTVEVRVCDATALERYLEAVTLRVKVHRLLALNYHGRRKPNFQMLHALTCAAFTVKGPNVKTPHAGSKSLWLAYWCTVDVTG
jgi:hypothetical protein